MVRVLVIGRTPPPYLGAPIMLGFLVQNQLRDVELRHLPIRLSADDSQVGSFRWTKLVRLMMFILQILYARISFRPKVLYYAPELVTPRSTVLRDAAILAAVRMFFSKTVLHLHSSGHAKVYDQLPRWQQWLVRRGFSHADGVIRLSRLTPNDGELLQAKREYVVRNGIVDPFPAGSPARDIDNCEPSRPLRILFVSLLCEPKGLLVLLDACGKLRDRGVPFSLELMGPFESDEFAARVRSRIAELQIDDSVQALGVMSGDAKFATFAAADVLCHPTYYDTFPIVLLEAMAAGLPVVSTYHSGIPEIVEDGETGYLVQPRDAAAVADRLGRLAGSPELRGRLGAAGRAKFAHEFTLPRHLEQMREVFLDVASQSHSIQSVRFAREAALVSGQV